jgi:glycosyltransferase involved in cell wall biosynthesis
MLQILREMKPDLIHVHHAYRAGVKFLNPLVEIACSKIPLVVSPGGTDIHISWNSPEQRGVVSRVCRQARFLITQSEEILAHLREILPEAQERLVFIPKSIIWLGDESFAIREAANCNAENILFFFPAGIRPVKGNLECLRKLGKVYAARPHIRAIFAGAPIDPEYSAHFEREIRRHQGFARWIAPIPPAAIRLSYLDADIILNASFSEGLSNALIEATAVGKPVLASKIAGNRWPVLGDNGDHPMGLLYDLDDPEDFLKKALILVDEEEVRRRLGEAGKRRAAFLPTPEEEAAQLAHVYEMALGMD